MTSLLLRLCSLATLAVLPVGVPSGSAEADGGHWRWPLRGHPTVVRGFDPPPAPWEAGHRGVDLGGRAGEPVLAAGDGRVRYAGMVAGRGVVSIVHGPMRTTYEPVRPSVRAGQRVSAGQRIGVLRRRGGHCVPAVCLHWGLLRGTTYLDPLTLVGRGPSRLLPVWGVPQPPHPWRPPPRGSGPWPDGVRPRNVAEGSSAAPSPGAAPRSVPTTRHVRRGGTLDHVDAPALTLTAGTTAAAGGLAASGLLGVLLVTRARRRRRPP